jgi:hypothetical protein
MRTPLPSNKFTTIDTFAEPVEPPSIASAIAALSKSLDDVLVILAADPDSRDHKAFRYAELCALEMATGEFRSSLRNRKI